MENFFDLDLGIMTEGTKETTSECPSVDITKHIDADNSGNKTIPVPGGDSETPTAKPYDAAEVPVPGGDKETPNAKPYDVAEVPDSSNILIDEDEYNKAIEALKKSFTEGANILDMLQKSKIQHKTVQTRQNEYVESAMDDAYFEAMCSGPIFEAVERADKEEVKALVEDIREDVIKFVNKQKFKMYKPNTIGRLISGLLLSPLDLVAAIAQIWNNRLWQVVGVVLVDEGNVGNLKKVINDEFKEKLGVYNIIMNPAPLAFLDVFRTRFNWKNSYKPFFVIIDKRMPAEIKSATKAADEQYLEANKEADADKPEEKN